jgi:hypothetical protein
MKYFLSSLWNYTGIFRLNTANHKHNKQLYYNAIKALDSHTQNKYYQVYSIKCYVIIKYHLNLLLFRTIHIDLQYERKDIP